jgi:hypothetical protein
MNRDLLHIEKIFITNWIKKYRSRKKCYVHTFFGKKDNIHILRIPLISNMFWWIFGLGFCQMMRLETSYVEFSGSYTKSCYYLLHIRHLISPQKTDCSQVRKLREWLHRVTQSFKKMRVCDQMVYVMLEF